MTKEELEALPDGAKVFVVFNKMKNGKRLDEPDWDSQYTRWRTKDGDILRWEHGHVNIVKYDRGTYKAYLEEPERPVPTPDEVELPF